MEFPLTCIWHSFGKISDKVIKQDSMDITIQYSNNSCCLKHDMILIEPNLAHLSITHFMVTSNLRHSRGAEVSKEKNIEPIEMKRLWFDVTHLFEELLNAFE